MTDVWTALQVRMRAQPGSPIVTFVDVASGSRTELSALSLQNAAAKIANALRDAFDLDTGARVDLRIPVHWQRAAWCAGIWTAGCVLLLDTQAGSAAEPDLIVAGPAEASAAASANTTSVDIAVVSLHPFGLPIEGPLPSRTQDVTLAVRQQPDAYLYDRPDAGMPALGVGGRVLTQDQVLELAADRAAAWGLATGGRLLAPDGLGSLDAHLAALAVPLARQASTVLVAGDADLDAITAHERTTAVASTR